MSQTAAPTARKAIKDGKKSLRMCVVLNGSASSSSV